MGYVIIEENFYKKLLKSYSLEDMEIQHEFSESDYWMNREETCAVLNISFAALNGLGISRLNIKGKHMYKRAEVYKLKTELAKELIESGAILGDCTVINDEEDMLK